ncbi:MAG: DedA family protein [Rhodospirillaceae bacterium]|nr:DedA family protein [Rhodospirillaceae bacterium]
MLRNLYAWTMRLAARRDAPLALAAVSFAESSFFPIPPDALLIPMVLARPERAWRLAAICTAASVLGGLLGYAIGRFLFDTVGRALIGTEGVATFQSYYATWGLWVILVKGLTPIPYKLVTIASGFASFSLGVFILASVVTRGARFFLVAALLRRYGTPIRGFIERYLTWLTTGFVLLVVGGIVAARYLA